jgi:hydroxymethylpyrimidine pyrophosphatase-like HAD family hydrolase
MESLRMMPCHTCRKKIKIFKVFGDIKGNCVVCFNNNVDIIMFKCGHYACKICIAEMRHHATQHVNNEQYEDSNDEDVVEHIDNFISISEEIETFYALIDQLECRVQHLGEVVLHAQLSFEELTKLKDWIDANQAIYCHELLQSFDDIIEAMQLTCTAVIDCLRAELGTVPNDF